MNARNGWVIGMAAGLVAACSMAALQGGRPGSALAPPRIETDVTGPATPWTRIEPLERPDDFRFVVVSDRTGEHRPGVFRDAMPKINLLQPAFVVSVGDLIEGYTEERAELAKQWDEIDDYVGRLRMPFFYAAGNHDMSNRVMADVWRERYGPTYYHFRYKDVLFLVLNSELFGMVHKPKESLPSSETLEEQLAFTRQVLAENRDVRWTLVLVHQPLWDKPEIHARWLEVEQMLGDRPYTVFAGHFHKYKKHVRGDRSFITLATTGGGSALRGAVFGEFDHVALVTMKSDGPVIANLMLDGIRDTDIRTVASNDAIKRLERAISLTPIGGTGELFRSAVARFEISNDGEAPLEVEGRFQGRGPLRAELETVQSEVAPGTTGTIEVLITAHPPAAWNELLPVEVEWSVRTADATGRPLEVPVHTPVLPEPRRSVPRVEGQVRVDGDLVEWTGRLPFSAVPPREVSGSGSYDGNADASFEWGIARDDAYLYIAVDVTDDSGVFSTEHTYRYQDRVGVRIDPRPDPERSRNESVQVSMRNGAIRKMIMPNAGPVEPLQDERSRLFSARLPEGIRTASVRTEKGYTAEFAIPTSALDEPA
jgi:hypothetical protein